MIARLYLLLGLFLLSVTAVNAQQTKLLKGKVVEEGRHEELLLQEGLYHRLVQKQFVG